MADLIKEACAFFHSEPGYRRLFFEIRQRYQQLGRIGGSVMLDSLEAGEQRALGLFFGKDFSRRKSLRVELASVEAALAASRFKDVSLIELLSAYFGEAIQTKEELAREWQANWEELFAGLLAEFPDACCQRWLTELAGRQGAGYRLVLKKFNDDPASLRGDLRVVCTALGELPVHHGRRERLPIFASRVTSYPHGLDVGTEVGRLLQAALVAVYDVPAPETSEELAELLLRAGIVKDDISSYVTTHGLVAYRGRAATSVGTVAKSGAIGDQSDIDAVQSEDIGEKCGSRLVGCCYAAEEQKDLVKSCGDKGENTLTTSGIVLDAEEDYGKSGATAIKMGVCDNFEVEHSMWLSALNTVEVLQVTLRNLLGVSRAVSPSGVVYIVENPAIFSEILDRFPGRPIPLICSNGQFRLACLYLLDLLVESGTKIFYSGDFDPEGLGMAQRLLERYPGRVALWRYDVEDYQQAMSEQVIEERRLRKLEKVCASELLAVKEEMLRVGRAGYQENLIEEMVADLAEWS